MVESRVRKTLINAKVNLLFYLLILALSFFSRKIFLDCLGASFVGLTGTLTNILGYLNLAELGIGSAIAFNLYSPLRKGDKQQIIDLISLFGYYYRNIGIVVCVASAILSIFFPFIFHKTDFSLGVIYFAFYSFLASSLFGYFINYRQILLTADQKNYVVTAYYQTANIIKIIIQLSVAYYLNNYYLWIVIELSFSICYCFILNWKINQVYPWLKTSVKNGKIQRKNYPQIFTSTKQVFVHKIKDFILTQSDQLFIFAFVSLKMVAYYGNYVLVISKITSLLSTVLDSVGASVGNLVAEKNNNKQLQVFWELMALRYFFAGFICFCIYNLITPFITIWLGPEYILSKTVLWLLLVNLFIMITRGTIDNFNFAYGHFGDVWAAWTEGILNIAVTIVGGYFWGVAGILLGKTISLIPIIVIWKPIYLFKYGFKYPLSHYWVNTAKYYSIFIVSTITVRILLKHLPDLPDISLGWWFIHACICSFLFGAFYIILMVIFAPGAKDLFKRMYKR